MEHSKRTGEVWGQLAEKVQGDKTGGHGGGVRKQLKLVREKSQVEPGRGWDSVVMLGSR